MGKPGLVMMMPSYTYTRRSHAATACKCEKRRVSHCCEKTSISTQEEAKTFCSYDVAWESAARMSRNYVSCLSLLLSSNGNRPCSLVFSNFSKHKINDTIIFFPQDGVSTSVAQAEAASSSTIVSVSAARLHNRNNGGEICFFFKKNKEFQC